MQCYYVSLWGGWSWNDEMCCTRQRVFLKCSILVSCNQSTKRLHFWQTQTILSFFPILLLVTVFFPFIRLAWSLMLWSVWLIVVLWTLPLLPQWLMLSLSWSLSICGPILAGCAFYSIWWWCSWWCSKGSSMSWIFFITLHDLDFSTTLSLTCLESFSVFMVFA